MAVGDGVGDGVGVTVGITVDIDVAGIVANTRRVDVARGVNVALCVGVPRWVDVARCVEVGLRVRVGLLVGTKGVDVGSSSGARVAGIVCSWGSTSAAKRLFFCSRLDPIAPQINRRQIKINNRCFWLCMG